MPFYPSKVLRTKERASIPCSSVVLCLGLTFESLKELGVHHCQRPRQLEEQFRCFKLMMMRREIILKR